mgnify:CR=1 FL=1
MRNGLKRVPGEGLYNNLTISSWAHIRPKADVSSSLAPATKRKGHITVTFFTFVTEITS